MPVLEYFDKNISVSGPYFNKKQKRNFATYRNLTTGKKTQKTYAKYLMEQHLGRELLKDEEVDHIDRIKTNDVIVNLQILKPGEHSSIDSKRAKHITQVCGLPGCENLITRSPKKSRDQKRKGFAGPFCGATCRGKYGKMVQETGEKLPTQEAFDSEYYYLDKK